MQITWASTLSDELSLRIGPLKQAWEARGPGLLREIASQVGEGFLVDAATILPIAPEHGGGGEIDASRRIVKIEAVLANPHPQLPEVLRLAWLLARLGVAEGQACRLGPRPQPWPRALVPIVLTAAETVELACCDDATIRLAEEVWQLPMDDA